jgi:hypothetical protein
LIRNDANIIDLTLDLSRKVILGLFSAALSVGIAAVLVAYFKLGITGLILGLMSGRAVLSVSYPYLIGRFLKIPWSSQFSGILRPTLVSILLFFFTMRLGDFLASSAWLDVSWIGLFFSVGLTVVLFSMLVFVLGLSRDQQKRVLQRVRSAILAER